MTCETDSIDLLVTFSLAHKLTLDSSQISQLGDVTCENWIETLKLLHFQLNL